MKILIEESVLRQAVEEAIDDYYATLPEGIALITALRTALDAAEKAEEQLATVTKERDEAVDAVRKLSEGQPFNAVVAADITRRGLEQLATVTQERDELVEALTECRSSVKFDLNKYERMALDYSRLGPEGEDKCAIAEGEATRLHKLIDTIDALAKLDADKGEV